MEFINLEKYCVLDLETIGFDPKNDFIIEVALVKIENKKVIDTFNMLVKPECEIPSLITEITKITPKMVEDAPVFEEILEKILNFISDFPILGHNIRFDISFLKNKIKDFNPKTIDLLSISRRFLKGLINYKLETIAKSLNEKYFPSHRVLDDCLATFEAFERIKQNLTK